jgi:hypothetical protein
MAFEAKRLRISVPCSEDEGSLIPYEAVAADEKIIKAQCIGTATLVFGGCIQDTQTILVTSGDVFLMDGDQLFAARQELEARLDEVGRAEQALQDKGATD